MQYSVVGMIRLGGLELIIQWWNDWIRWIGMQYSVVGMIKLGGLELNIQWWNDQIRLIRI
jgi:hypothetical protein